MSFDLRDCGIQSTANRKSELSLTGNSGAPKFVAEKYKGILGNFSTTAHHPFLDLDYCSCRTLKTVGK